MPEHVPGAPAPDADLKADLDAALLALPARYRDPILLCHLQGFTRREAAEQLGCAEGTLSAWLSRGLEKLRHRLRGLDPTKALSVAAVSVPTALATSTAHAAVATVVATASIPPTVSVLVEGVLHMLWMKKATAAAFALCAVFALGVGVGLGTRVESSGAIANEGADKPGANKPGTDPTKPKSDAIEKEIAELDAAIRVAERKLALTSDFAASLEKNIDLMRKAKPDTKPSPEHLAALAKAQADFAQAEAELQALRIKRAKLKVVKAAATPDDIARTVTDLKKELAHLDNERQEIETLREQVALKSLILEKRRKELSALLESLQLQRKEIKPGAYLELKIFTKRDGDLLKVEFSLTETDANGQPIGTVTFREQAMLQKLLRRAHNDPTAPKELRVTTQPATALTGWPTTALKACVAAGYKTVKYTGYVCVGAGYMPPLDPDQKGNAIGYKHYEGAEKNPVELIKEIEEGQRRY
jgi:hypothetical protein